MQKKLHFLQLLQLLHFVKISLAPYRKNFENKWEYGCTQEWVKNGRYRIRVKIEK